jgi:hypothetical protein
MKGHLAAITLTAAAAITMALAAPGFAGASSIWTLQSVPVPDGANVSGLNGVSCPSLDDCMAVGSYLGSSGDVAFAEQWNGSDWTVLNVPPPGGAAESTLAAVSCVTANRCTAVGSYGSSPKATMPLAERWNGTSWVAEQTGHPRDATSSRFAAVSCFAATTCTAVGSYQVASGDVLTLVEHKSGKGGGWFIQPTPATGATSSFLNGVSCTGLTDCTSVGGTVTGKSYSPLAESWTGTPWTVVPANPSGAVNAQLSGVSCTSPASCVAVGSASLGSAILAEYWNGSVWAAQTVPLPAHGTAGNLDAVSCGSPASCNATGVYSRSSVLSQTLAERWNGTNWQVQKTAQPGNHKYLAAVSCPSYDCTAVGGTLADRTSTTDVPLAERN